jgi:hypothetical protein
MEMNGGSVKKERKKKVTCSFRIEIPEMNLEMNLA